MEDYTSKYKGEQVEVALFGGEYQEGVLTAYCYVDEVAHIELNGHILVPLQNIASLHCSSRCDAPRTRTGRRAACSTTTGGTSRTTAKSRRSAPCASSRSRNIVKAWLRAARASAACSRAIGWVLDGYRRLSIFVFCGLLLVERRLLDVRPRRPRDGRRARAPARRGAAAALDGRAARRRGRGREAEALSHPRRVSRARSRRAVGPRSSSIAISVRLRRPRARRPSSRASSRHELAHVTPPRRPHPDRRRRGRGRDHRVEPHRRLASAIAAVRARTGRVGLRPPAALAEARVRGRPDRGEPLRLAARPRGRADPARAGVGARRVPCQPRHRAAVHDQPVPGEGARGAVRDAPAGRPSACADCATLDPDSREAAASRRADPTPCARGGRARRDARAATRVETHERTPP